MNDLLRPLAPVSAQAWKEIDAEATRTLKVLLAARQLVDFNGPLGWETAAVSLGRAEKLSPPLQEGVASRVRLVQPLVEIGKSRPRTEGHVFILAAERHLGGLDRARWAVG